MSFNFEPLVSIVIPVYNGEEYLKKAIDSALAQTYKNIEIIVVNDGSDDNTEKIALSFGNKIRYFKKENGGVATALNLAIKEAKGEYISWLSHDDSYLPIKIEKQIEVLNQLKNKKTILYSNVQFMDETDTILKDIVFIKDINEPKLLDTALFPIINGLISGCTLFIKKELFEEFGYFRTDLLTTQDYDLWFKMFKKYPVKYIPEILINSRLHPKQDSKNIRAFHLKEVDDLWQNIVKNTSKKEFSKMFPSAMTGLSILLKNFNITYSQGAAKEAIIKFLNFYSTKKNILLISEQKDDFTADFYEKLSSEYNIFVLNIEKDIFTLSFENENLFQFKLKSPVGFEFNNMFFQNEVYILVEKLLFILNVDLVHLNTFYGIGFGIMDAINNLSIPVFYTASDFNKTWANNNYSPKLERQIKLFASKIIFPKLDFYLIPQKSQLKFQKIVESVSQSNYSFVEENELCNYKKIESFYTLLLKNKKNKRTPKETRKAFLSDLLYLQRHN